MSKSGSNTFSIFYKNIRDGKNTKTDFDPLYAFGILLVKKNTVEELTEKIKASCTMTRQESLDFIKSRFSEMDGLKISQIKADLLCKITLTLVENPARGEFCTHLDCFNLEYFLRSMEQNTVRKWICPLCRKRCLNLRVDKYFGDVLEIAEKTGEDVTKVFFREDGSFTFSENQQYENHEHTDQYQTKKLKTEVLSILSLSEEGDSDSERQQSNLPMKIPLLNMEEIDQEHPQGDEFETSLNNGSAN